MSEDPPVVASIEEGKLLDYITGKEKKETGKELVRQHTARALFHEYGISVDDMEPDFKVKVDGRVMVERRRRQFKRPP